MKNTTKVRKILFMIAILIIMAGAIVGATAGFKFGMIYEKHSRIELYIEKEYKVEDIKNIIKEVIGNEKVIAQNIETFNKDISFTVNSISKEQIKSLTEKINKKYELKENIESVVVIDEPHTKLSDIMKPYILPLVISTIITVVYLVLRFKKQGMLNVALFSVLSITVLQALYYSVIAICRIPVSKITMPLSLLVYLLTICWIVLELAKNEKRTTE